MSHSVDVIIPVYNRSHCLPNVIKQLENQTFRDFCAIFVDDGSTDHSYELLQELLPAASFPYRLIRKQNGGAGSARNAGMRAATADWINFIDSDDAMLPQYLEYLHAAATQSHADLAICNLQTIPEDSDQPPKPADAFHFQEVSGADGMRSFYTRWVGPPCLLVNRNYQVQHDLFFDEACTYCEDIPFITDLIASAQRIAMINDELYVYYTNPGSLSHSPHMDKFRSAFDAFERVANRLLQSDTESSHVFRQVGHARYYIATLRKAAVQFSRKDFMSLAKIVKFRQYRHQISHLAGKQKFACYLLLLSKTGFYYGSRLLFKD